MDGPWTDSGEQKGGQHGQGTQTNVGSTGQSFKSSSINQTKEAGIQWIPGQLSSVLYHEERRCAPPPPKPLSPYPSHCRLSPLAALQRDGLGWCKPRRDASANQYPTRMPNSVCKYYHLFPTGIVFLWSIPQISCRLSIDCYYFFGLINHNNGMKVFICVHHFSRGSVVDSVHMYSIIISICSFVAQR